MLEDGPGTAALGKDLGRTLQVFVRAVRARQLYQANNVVLVRLMSDLQSAFQAVLQKSPEISLRVRSDAFLFEGDPVLEEPNPDASIPFTFFRDGIRRLDLSAGLSANELEVLVAATAASFTYDGLGDDLVSYLWRHELEHLRYVVVDTAIVDAVPGQPGTEVKVGTADDLDREIDALLHTIYGASSDDVGPKAVRVDATDLPAKRLADSLERIEDLIPGFHPARSLDAAPAWVESFSLEVAREDETRITLRTFSAALDALATPLSPSVAEGIFEALLQLFDASLVRANLDLPARLLLGVRELARYEHNRAGAERWIAEATQEARLRQATQAFGSGADTEQLRSLAAFFRACGTEGVPALLALIPRIESAEHRRMVSALALEIGVPSIDPVLHLLGHEQAYVAQEGVFLLYALGTPRAISALREAEGHPQPLVRWSLLAAARKTSSERALELARRYLDDPEPRVVELAGVTLAELQDQSKVAELEAKILRTEGEPLSPSLKEALHGAYAQIMGPTAVAVLGRALKNGDEATQLAAIRALALVKTPGAVAAIRQAGLSFNKRVRQAVKDALSTPEKST